MGVSMEMLFRGWAGGSTGPIKGTYTGKDGTA